MEIFILLIIAILIALLIGGAFHHDWKVNGGDEPWPHDAMNEHWRE